MAAVKKKAARKGTAKPGEENASRNLLLQAAKKEIARHGLHGTRVDRIAQAAKINKQLIYYYFGDKESLYLAVLEDVYRDIRSQESALDLGALPPLEAMTRLLGFTFDYVMANREFVLLLTNENLMEGRHLKRSKAIKAMRSPLVEMMGEILKRGEKTGCFRSGIDSVQLYISISGLCFFYSANIHTLGILFDRDLQSAAAIAERRAHVVSFALAALRPEK
jgi:TetR/AcrR family transcriptional regulator